MALAGTAEYDKLVVETSEDGTTWTRICGMMNATISYTTQVDEDEIPDCDDESLPHTIVVNVRSTGVTISGEGKWAASVHEKMMQWWKQGLKKHTRVGYLDAETGDTEYVSGQAIIDSMEDSRSKGSTNGRNFSLRMATAVTFTAATT